jgi:hypothetical protein
VPFKLIACVPAPSMMVTAPVRTLAAVGVNVTITVQVPLDAMGLPQVFVWAKSPLAVTLVIVRLLVPLLMRVTLCDALVVLTTWLPNVSVATESCTPGA